jgi:predicted dinucleotide-binding enzyme
MKHVAVIGSGQVAKVLGAGLLKHGYRVTMGTRSPEKLSDWLAGPGAGASILPVDQAVTQADAVLLAVKGSAAEAVVKPIAAQLAGKLVMDTTNPIADAPPQKGVLQLFTGPNESLMERLQALAPEAHFVKVFSCVGNALMVNPNVPGGPPSMFIAGNSAEAKASVRHLLDQFGWLTVDLGEAESARGIEPLVITWCLPGFRENKWSHAFKLLNY